MRRSGWSMSCPKELPAGPGDQALAGVGPRRRCGARRDLADDHAAADVGRRVWPGSLFPNLSILQGVTFALCYRARPYGDDPHKCIFESYAIERFPPGEEPQTEWVYAEPTAEKWGSVLAQDFSNMKCGSEGHEITRLPRHSAQSAPGAEGHQFPP